MAESILNNMPVRGLQIIKYRDDDFEYIEKETPIETRDFYPRMYWMPIPRAELRKAPQLDALPYE